MLSRPPESIQQIALLRLSAIGDVTLVAGIIPALQQHFPHATLHWITTPACHELLASLVQDVNFILIDKPKSPRAWWRARQQLRHLAPDVLLAMQASLSANCLYPLIRAPIKLGFDRTRARDGHRHVVTHQIDAHDEHLMDGFLRFARALGVPAPTASWSQQHATRDINWVNTTLPSPQRWICLHPKASQCERTWSCENYVKLIQAMINRFNLNVVITGGPSTDEVHFNQRIANTLPARCLNLTGQLSLPRLRALFAHVDAVIAPDTAAVHLATSVNTPVVGLYAVANPLLTGPYQAHDHSVNRYPDAINTFHNASTPPSWHTRVHHPSA
ncbi:MAG: glycosyltransferase family 9 protein, partial [Pseudomonadota bacterium]|nr:glycosyltransferase family 9 protein [Pseudomonadota bacterium]